jgi:DNA-binding transcriptional LysR family regulator
MNLARLDWDDLRLFLAIARAGTLSAAARNLKLSQPTAGRRLRWLEDACGFALFQRTSDGFQLTDEGETVLLHAERMEEEALALERQLSGVDRGVEGLLRLSSSDWFGRLVLAPRIADFTIANPMLTVELVADFRLLDLDRREADLVFRFRHFDGADIVQRRFVRVNYDLFAAPEYLDRHGPISADADGASHRLITMDSHFEDFVDVAWLRRRFPKGQLSVRSNSRDVQAEACKRGAGLAVLPTIIGKHLGLTPLSPKDPPPGREIWLGYHTDLKRLKRLRALVDHLCASIGDAI